MKKSIINHSGGAKGSDIAWESIGKKYGVETIAYSFKEHRCLSPKRFVLSKDELDEGWEHVISAATKMNKFIGKSSIYVKKLLSRNWFQIKQTDMVLAIGQILKPGEKGAKYENTTDMEIVDGGTGYAVMMAIDKKLPVYVFEQYKNKWYKWEDGFKEIDYIPKLKPHFTGIGTRELNENGINAIKSVYKNTYDDQEKA